jgi:hypothetical protein
MKLGGLPTEARLRLKRAKVGGVDGTRTRYGGSLNLVMARDFWQKVLTVIDLQGEWTSSVILWNPLECARAVATSWQRQLPRRRGFALARGQWFAVVLPRR